MNAEIQKMVNNLDAKERAKNIRGYTGIIFLFFISFFVILIYQSSIVYDNLFLSYSVNFLIVFIFFLSLFKMKLGLYVFIFLVPLLNSITTILAIRPVPILLLLFFSLFLAFILNYANKKYGENWNQVQKNSIFDTELMRLIILFIIVFTISASISIFRYINFYPFFTNNFYDLEVNVEGTSSLSAVFWIIKFFFNYIVGFGLVIVVFNVLKSLQDIIKAILVVVSSTLISAGFLFFQYFFNPYIGSFPYWVNSGRFNATFSDPNALGAFTLIVFPVFFVLIVYFKRWYLKILFLFFLLLLLFMVFLSGSRVSALSIIISIFIFMIFGLVWFFYSNKKIKSRKIKLRNIVIMAVLLVIVFTFIFSTLILFTSGRIENTFLMRFGVVDRTYSSFNTGIYYFKKLGFIEAFKAISNYRYIYWGQALSMADDYRFSGIGIGSYVIQLPNYFIKNRVGFDEVDYVGNYYLQILSEFGVIGLILVSAVFILILIKIIRFFNRQGIRYIADRYNWILIGLFISIIAMLVAVFFGAHTTFIEIQFTFWFIIGLALVFIKIRESRYLKTGSYTLFINGYNKNYFAGISLKIGSVCLLLFFLISMTFSSVTTLSINVSQNLFDIKGRYNGWENEYGFYGYEKFQGVQARWTGIDASEAVDNEGETLVIPMKNNIPEDFFMPVSVKIYLDNIKVQEVVLDEPGWKEVEISLPVFLKKKFTITFVLSDSWVPKELNINNDTRELGILIGDYYFK